MEEIWKETEYQGYFISNFGRIKGRTGKIINLQINKNGYCNFSIYPNGRYGKSKNLKIHRLVAEAFIPNPNNYPIINHINGIKTDNRVENLEWCTYSYNATHAFENGLFIPQRGCENTHSKLTKEDVKWIRKNYKPRDKVFGVRALAKKFNMNHSNISRIINNIKYK